MAPTGVPVLDIPEVLEQILLNVSQIDLFVFQHVSSTFNDTIFGSPLLQRRLYGAVEAEKQQRARLGCGNPYSEWKRAKAHVSTLLYYKLSLQIPSFDLYSTKRRYTGKADIPTLALDYLTMVLGWKGKSGKVYPKGSWEKISLGMIEGRVDVQSQEEHDYDGSDSDGLECLTGCKIFNEVPRWSAYYYGSAVGGYKQIPTGGTLGDIFVAVRELTERDIALWLE